MRSEGYCSWFVCVCVCVCVCPLSDISPLERLFVLKSISRTQRATKQKFCGVFSETAPLRRSSTPSVVRPYVQSAIFLVYAHAYFSCIYAHDTPPRVQHFSAFHWVCLCVCVCVCLSVKSHLTYGASVRPENAVTYSAGNEGQKLCGVFSETAPLQRSSTPSVVRPCV